MADTSILNLTRYTSSQASPTDSVPFGHPSTTSDYRIYIQDLLTVALQGGLVPTWAPQGRLTLTSGSPVMTSDESAATSIYYDPHVGQWVPVYNGSAFMPYSIGSGLTLTLNTTNHLRGGIYDVFVFLNGSTLTLGAGPAWTSDTTRSAAISQVGGLWVNSALITLTNGATTYSNVAVNEATYLGSFYCTANGQTSFELRPSAAAGGSNNVIGLFNAYNRVSVSALELDSNASWVYSTVNIWRAADNSAANRITWLDGLGQCNFVASYNNRIIPATSTDGGVIGIAMNGTTSSSLFPVETTAYGGTMGVPASVKATGYPIQGLNFVQAMEGYINGGSGTSVTFGGVSQNFGLVLEIDL